MDVYISSDANASPSQFENTVAIKQVDEVIIDTTSMPFLENGYSVTVYIHAVNELQNTLLNNTMHADYTDGSLLKTFVETDGSLIDSFVETVGKIYNF